MLLLLLVITVASKNMVNKCFILNQNDKMWCVFYENIFFVLFLYEIYVNNLIFCSGVCKECE